MRYTIYSFYLVDYLMLSSFLHYKNSRLNYHQFLQRFMRKQLEIEPVGPRNKESLQFQVLNRVVLSIVQE